MAVTFIQQPAASSIQSSDNPILYVFSSNQNTQPNFCFIVESLINGIVVSTDMVFPERSNRAHYDAMKVTLPTLRPAARSVGIVAVQTLSTLQVRISERYGTTPVTQSPYSSNTCKVAKARCDDEEFKLNWLTDKYVPSVAWLTNAPNATQLVSRKHSVWASILNTDSDVTVGLAFYNLAGSLVHIYANATQPFGDKVNVCLDPAVLNSILDLEGLTLEEISKVEVEMNVSDKLTFIYFDEDCGEFNQLSWLNNLGAYDQFLFTHNRDVESAISSQEYKKQFGHWNASNLFVYDDLISGDTVYVKSIQPTGTLYSGWISESYQNWLNEIYHSVSTIAFNEAKVEKLIVTDTKAVNNKHRFEDTLNFQVTYKKSNFKSVNQ